MSVNLFFYFLSSFLIEEATFSDSVLMPSENKLSSINLPVDTSKIDSIDILIGVRREQFPVFEGGEIGLRKFIADNLRYPDQNCVEGTIYVGFIIDVDGQVKNIEVKRGFRGLPAYNAEAIRLVKLTNGKWKPSTIEGKPVETNYTVPIKFKLN